MVELARHGALAAQMEAQLHEMVQIKKGLDAALDGLPDTHAMGWHGPANLGYQLAEGLLRGNLMDAQRFLLQAEQATFISLLEMGVLGR